jgi:predicted AlkP superfamily pyrophosphatase or phosphodiesterase
MDKVIGYLYLKLKEVNLESNLNIIIVSDHGMTSMKDTILIGNYVDINLIDLNKTVFGVLANIYAKNESVVGASE